MNGAIIKQNRKDSTELVKKVIKPSIILIENAIKQYDNFDVFAKIRLLHEIQKLEPHYSYDLKTFLLDRIHNAIYLTLTAYQEMLSFPLDSKEVDQLAWNILDDLVTEPFHNLTLDQRIDRAVIRTFKAISTQIQFLDNKSDPMRLIKPYFLSNGQVSGGSAQLWNTRLLIGETLRAYQFTAKRYFKKIGVKEVKVITREGDSHTFPLNKLPSYPYPGCTWTLVPITT